MLAYVKQCLDQVIESDRNIIQSKTRNFKVARESLTEKITVHSYSTHIATLNSNGTEILWANPETYSPTTTRQLSSIKQYVHLQSNPRKD